MKIKVCGMRDPENISVVAQLGIDFMGFIFYPPSPRYCGDTLTRETLEKIPFGIEPVAVTVDAAEEEILSLSDRLGFMTFQLHGEESPNLCRRLRERGFRIIKAFGIKDEEDLKRVGEYSGSIDYFLFDTATKRKGGSGKKFNWELLSGYSLPEPFLLSGGIAPDDKEAIAGIASHERFAGIDLNSRFEITPGIKDYNRLKDFIE